MDRGDESPSTLNLAFDKTCEIIFRLVERALGLKEEMAEADSVQEWVREAMEQTGLA